MDKYERSLREEGIELREGRAFKLVQILAEQGRIEDLKRLGEEPACRKELYRKFGL